MKRLLVVLLATLFLWGCNSTSGNEFVTVSDGHFEVQGKPYYFIGANYWYGAILGSQGSYGDRERLVRELDHLKSTGIVNLRILAGAEGPDNEPFRVTPALLLSPGHYSDDMLDGLDFLLAEMGKRGQKAVLYLNNSWDWSGGYAQYLNWSGYGDIPYPNVAPHTWPQFMSFSGRFHSCKPCIMQFEDHIRFMLGRTNRYTGVKYTEDPTVMSWEIGNEPRAFSDDNIPAFEEMIRGVAALIKELDHNHLLTTGTEGEWGCENRMELFQRIHSNPDIDYLTMHIWPKNWSWLDISDIGGSLNKATENTDTYIRDHLKVAGELHEPLVLEEFGLPRDHHGFSPAETTEFRDTYFTHIFDLVLSNAASGGFLAGCNFWAYAGEGRPSGDTVYWKVGDDYLGDPPQEEQGLNSVFDTDSTIEIISDFNARLKAKIRGQ